MRLTQILSIIQGVLLRGIIRTLSIRILKSPSSILVLVLVIGIWYVIMTFGGDQIRVFVVNGFNSSQSQKLHNFYDKALLDLKLIWCRAFITIFCFFSIFTDYTDIISEYQQDWIYRECAIKNIPQLTSSMTLWEY